MSSNLFSVIDRGNGRELIKHNPADGSIVDSYNSGGSIQVNGFSLNGSDGNILVGIYDGSNHGIRYLSQDTLTERWKQLPPEFRKVDVFANGDLLTYNTPTIERRDPADGSIIASYNTEDSLTRAVYVEPSSDGGWFTAGGTSGNDKVAKFDSVGTELWAVEHPDSGYNDNVPIEGVVGGPNGGAIIGGDETVVRLDSTGGVLWNTTIDYFTPNELKVDDSGHVVGVESRNRDIRQLNLSDGTVITDIDEPDGDGVNTIAVEKDGGFYSGANSGVTRYDNTGSVVYQVQTNRTIEYGLSRFPDYATHPDSWITEVTKSASGTTVAGSGTMNTAGGSIVADASASATGTQSIQNTASSTAIVTSQATVTTSSATPQTIPPTTSADSQAAIAPSSATMQTASGTVINSVRASMAASTATPSTTSATSGASSHGSVTASSATMRTATPTMSMSPSVATATATSATNVTSAVLGRVATATAVNSTTTMLTVDTSVPVSVAMVGASLSTNTTSAVPGAVVSGPTVAASSTMMKTPSTSTSATSKATLVEAGAGPRPSTSVSTTAGASAVTYEATSMMPTPGFAVRIGASSIKHGATASTLTALEFERQIRELGSGPNGSALSGSQNRSELTNSNNE